MSEKGIAIADQAAGTKVATRDAMVADISSAARVVQLFAEINSAINFDTMCEMELIAPVADNNIDRVWLIGDNCVDARDRKRVVCSVSGAPTFTAITILPVYLKNIAPIGESNYVAFAVGDAISLVPADAPANISGDIIFPVLTVDSLGSDAVAFIATNLAGGNAYVTLWAL